MEKSHEVAQGAQAGDEHQGKYWAFRSEDGELCITDRWDVAKHLPFDVITLVERAALATQPAAGEPEQQTAINTDDLPTKKYPLGAFDFDATVAAGEPTADVRSVFEEAWSQAMCNDEGVPGPKPLRSLVDPEEYRGGGVKFAWRWFQRGAQSVAPPAAAPADEAVRIDARLLELYQAPFRFDERGGYICDAQNNMVADNHVEGDQAMRVRGWGRLSYRQDGEEVQDLMGQAMADALTARWNAAMRAQGDDRLLFTDAIMPGGLTET